MGVKKKYTIKKIIGEFGVCWWCGGKARYILDDTIDEIFICISCCKEHYKNAKLRKRVVSIEKAKKIKKSKILPIKQKQNSLIQEELG